MKKQNILFVYQSNPWMFESNIDNQNWNLARTLARTGHDVTLVYGSKFTSLENSYLKEGVIVTEVPAYIPITDLAKEYFFKLTIKKWINKNQEYFDHIKEENNSYIFTTIDQYRQQSTVKSYFSTILRKSYSKTGF
jgi:hypothetical protein